jgi:N-acetylglucosamine-6-phosphate deacetylase
MNIQNESNMTATDALNNGTTPALPDWMTSNSDAIDKAIEEYKDAKNDPDLLAKKDKINELTAQVNQLDEDMLFVKDDIIKRYP